jgi:hypothetical protein
MAGSRQELERPMAESRQELERVIHSIAEEGNVSVYFWAGRLGVRPALLREVAEAHGYTAYGEQMQEARRRGMTLQQLDRERGRGGVRVYGVVRPRTRDSRPVEGAHGRAVGQQRRGIE